MPTPKHTLHCRPKPLTFGTVESGLKVRVIAGPNADGLWKFRAEDRGRDRKSHGCLWGNLEEAQIWGAELFLKKLDGIDDDDGQVRTIGVVIARYYKHAAELVDAGGMAASTFRGIRSQIRRLREADPAFMAVPVRRVDYARVSALVLRLQRGGFAPNTVNRTVGVASVAFNWALRQGLISGTFPKMGLPKTTIRPKRAPSAEEITATIAQMVGWQWLVTCILYETGGRIGEVAKLRPDSVDFDRKEIHFEGKGRHGRAKHRTVPVSDELLKKIRWHLRTVGADVHRSVYRSPEYLLGLKPKSLRNTKYREALYAAQKRANVARFLPHDMRRSAVTDFQRAGVPIMVAAKTLGHTPEVMLSHYAQASMDDQRDALSAIRAHREKKKA